MKQLQLTCWPDHGAPDNPLPLLAFIKKCAALKDSAAPTLIHCSAGVGRTGAFIVIDAMLKQLKAKGELSILPFLKHIRAQRNFMVQTLEQFVFIHEALVETVLSGETNIKLAYLSRYITSLQSSFTTEESSVPFQLLDRQFSHVTRYKPQELEFSSAILPCNQLKNQSFDFLPMDRSRVILPLLKDEEGSDYINASWLNGHSKLREFIVTQHPLESHKEDFWRMLWDHNAQTVVLLSKVDHTLFPMFWPSSGLAASSMQFF